MRSAHRWRTIFAAALITSAGAVAVAAPAAHAATMNLTQFVNPFIGTDDSNAPNPVGGGAGGSTYPGATVPFGMVDRKSTRLNSSHLVISYAVFCLKKKKKKRQ